MASTHVQRAAAADDFVRTDSGVKSALLVYAFSLERTLAATLSLLKPLICARKFGSLIFFLAVAQSGLSVNKSITAFSTISTAGGGEAYAFTSEIEPLSSLSTSAMAASSAGSALPRSRSASSAMILHSASSFEILSACDSTCFFRSSALRRSPTIITSNSSQSFCACATTIFFCLQLDRHFLHLSFPFLQFRKTTTQFGSVFTNLFQLLLDQLTITLD
mmetsp:Transcript_19335/g.32389  ORF Transcript_19335/g.32389 Transcript_19335/m.32389 type:complete len:219 (+) Transcript_19335:5218-5874(+)